MKCWREGGRPNEGVHDLMNVKGFQRIEGFPRQIGNAEEGNNDDQ